MRKRWIVAMAAVVVIAAGAIGGTALAQESDTDEEGPKSLWDRVGEILGIAPETVEDAVQQAKQEMKDERVQNKLDAMVEAGVIDQETADEYLEWHNTRPEGMPDIFGKRGHGRGHGKHGFGEFRFRFGPEIGELLEDFDFNIEGLRERFSDDSGFKFRFRIPWHFHIPDETPEEVSVTTDDSVI